MNIGEGWVFGSRVIMILLRAYTHTHTHTLSLSLSLSLSVLKQLLIGIRNGWLEATKGAAANSVRMLSVHYYLQTPRCKCESLQLEFPPSLINCQWKVLGGTHALSNFAPIDVGRESPSPAVKHGRWVCTACAGTKPHLSVLLCLERVDYIR